MQDLKVNTSVLSDRFNQVEFQYNQRVKSSPGVSKEEIRKALKKNRNSWTNGAGTNSLIKIIEQGYTHQSGINNKSTHNADIEYYDFCVVDYDAWDKVANAPIISALPIADIEELPTIEKYCSFYQKSISHKQQAQNSHWYFVFNRRITSLAEFELVSKTIKLMLDNDVRAWTGEDYDHTGFDPCISNNPGQVTFAGIGAVTFISQNTIDVDYTIKIAKSQGVRNSFSTVTKDNDRTKERGSGRKNKVTSETTPPSITEKVLAYLHDELFLKIYDGDAGKLYSLHNSTQLWNQRDCESKNEVCRIEGLNPFSPTNTSNSSFMVIHSNGELPRFWDKSGNFTRKIHINGYESCQGTYLDYYFHIRQTKYNDFVDIKIDDSGAYPKGFFSKLLNHICDTHKIIRYQFDQSLLSLFQQILEEYKDKLYVVGWEGSKQQIQYCIHNESWKMVSANNLFKCYLNQKLVEIAGGQEKLESLYFEYMESREKKVTASVWDFFRKWFNDNDICLTVLCDRPEEKPHLISMQNGIYNTVTKTLEENTGQNWVFDNPSTSHKYFPVADNHPVIQNLLTYYQDWLGSKAEGDLCLAYQILCVQREAYKLRSMLILAGDSSRGKSTYANITAGIIKGMSKSRTAQKVSASMFLSKSGQKDSLLEGCYYVYMDEMNSLNYQQHDIEKLKLFIQPQHDRNIVIDPKHQLPREITFYGAFIGASEEVLKINTSDGLDNRIIYIRVDATNTNMNMSDRLQKLEDKSNQEIIHNWMISQPTQKWIDVFYANYKDESVVKNLVEKKRESEPLVEFVYSVLEMTDSEADVVSTNDIWERFNIWKMEESLQANFRSKQSFGMAFTKILTQSKYGVNWKGQKLNQEVRKYTKIKFKTQISQGF